MTAEEVIKKFKLEPLPEEGGFYRETYRDPRKVLDDTRSASTCIYYLVTPEEFSGLHAVKSTETFHFYAGDPVKMVQLTESGEYSEVTMGSDLSKNHQPQVIVPPYVWQGTKLLEGGAWALVGCSVAPGFEFEDFLGGSRAELSEKFPNHLQVVTEYTHS